MGRKKSLPCSFSDMVLKVGVKVGTLGRFPFVTRPLGVYRETTVELGGYSELGIKMYMYMHMSLCVRHNFRLSVSVLRLKQRRSKGVGCG